MSVCDTDNGASDSAQLASSFPATDRPHAPFPAPHLVLLLRGEAKAEFGGGGQDPLFPPHTHPSPVIPPFSARRAEPPAPPQPAPPPRHPRLLGGGGGDKGGSPPHPGRGGGDTSRGKGLEREGGIRSPGEARNCSRSSLNLAPPPPQAPSVSATGKNKSGAVLKKISGKLTKKERLSRER